MAQTKNYDLIIIGGGPAGVTAGIYAARERLDTLLITKDFGGQINRKAVEIRNYPGFISISGPDLINKFENHLKKFKVTVVKDKAIKIKKQGDIFSVITDNKGEFKSLSVIIASGADPRPLEVPGEKELIGKGVSYCSICDAPLYKNKTIAVIGGGNVGFEIALLMTKFAKKIYILEAGSILRANQSIQKQAQKSSKIEVINSASLKEIKGKNFVELIVYKHNNKLKELAVNGIFIAVGNVPATRFVKGLVNFNKKDEIKIDRITRQTNITGLFAAGDITDTRFKQLVIAAGDGAKAALAVSKYIRERKTL